MNVHQIKERYNCLDYLRKITVVKKCSSGYLCSCPWREDKSPSLSVTPNGKGWHDFATGESGNIIDLVCRCLGTKDYRRVCAEFDGTAHFSFPKVKNTLTVGKEEKAYETFQVKELRNRVLLDYLQDTRGIPMDIAQLFCNEAYYSFPHTPARTLFSVAFRNDKGGYELRNSFSKASVSPKWITSRLHRENAPYAVFEGFMDMLSFVTLCGEVRHNIIVLNSVSFAYAAIELLKDTGNPIYLCLDNDSAGDKATAEFMKELPQAKDCRGRFAPCKDVNEYLLAKR